jgi:general secretion pathway protein K
MPDKTPSRSDPLSSSRNSDGFIVVAVLWMLAALAAMISIYATFVINTAAAIGFHEDRLKADSLISAALELSAYRQLAARAGSRPGHGSFQFQLNQANVKVDFHSEAALIDLNMAQKPLLMGLFIALGTRSEDAARYADSILSWRTGAGKVEGLEPGQGTNQPDNALRGRKFSHVRELALVRELPPEAINRALPFLTVYSSRSQVNVLEAPEEVIAALPGLSRERVYALLAQRRNLQDNVEGLLAMLGDAQQYATTEVGRTLRVITQVRFDNGRQVQAEAVILILDAGQQPYAVLSWQDDSDIRHRVNR